MKLKGIAKGTIYIVIFLILLGLDQITKFLATTFLKDQEPFVLIENVLELNYLDGGNKGAAWGILSGKISLFIVLTIIVCIFITLIVIRIENVIKNDHFLLKKMSLLQILFVILISGAVGNLIDRIVNGYVVDFIYFKLINFPVFNVADCYVTVSAICLVIFCIFFMNDDEFTRIFSLKKQSGNE